MEYVPLGEVVQWPGNPKKHDAGGMDESLERFGFTDPLMIDERTGKLVEGHGRLEALQRRKKLGKEPPANIAVKGKDWMVPVIRGVSFKTDSEAEAYILAANRLVEAGGWDDEKTGAMLESLRQIDGGLLGTGFSADDVRAALEGGLGNRASFVQGKASIEDLKPHPRNYREHPEDQLAHIAESIKQHGFYRNVVLARDNTILAGHGVVLAAKKLGMKHVPVVRLDVAPEDPRALKVLTSDNEIRNLAAVDDRVLTELLRELVGTDAGLLGTGFDEAQLAALTFVSRPASEVATIDEAKEWVGMPEYSPSAIPFKIVVNVEAEADVAAFMQLVGVPAASRKFGRTVAFWWPPREKGDPSSVKFEDEGAANG